jgi:membrane-bound lytic murein transglycosylase A
MLAPGPSPWRAAALLFAGLWLVTLTWSLAPRLGPASSAVGESIPAAAPPAEDRLILRQTTFDRLPAFDRDDLAGAATALARSCGIWANKPAGQRTAIGGVEVTAAAWRGACARLQMASGDDPAALRAALESAFTPWAAWNNDLRVGLFTGYYEPLLRGSRSRSDRYRVPLYVRPADLVAIDLSAFRPEWKGIKIGGHFVRGAFEPYPDRAAIDAGALVGRGLELVWVDDAVDAFFLHIQGSGRVAMADGSTLRIGYAGQNGRPYVAIGKELVDLGALRREEVSMQSIRAWLGAHPDQATAILQKNPSYVFFRRLDGEGPLGSQGVALTPGRSLAVDTKFIPLGTPLWLESMVPAPTLSTPPGGASATPEPDRIMRRLLVAQDTGGAIRGPLRGDVFWGHGEEAADLAGRMKHRGRFWLLLPREAKAPPAG